MYRLRTANIFRATDQTLVPGVEAFNFQKHCRNLERCDCNAISLINIETDCKI